VGAAELLLDTAQLGADLGRNTVLIGELTALSSLAEVFSALKTLPPDPDVGRHRTGDIVLKLPAN